MASADPYAAGVLTNGADDLRRELDRLETDEFNPRDRSRAEAAELVAATLGLVDGVLRARLIQADALLRTGETAAGGRIAREVHQWAEEHDHRYLRARSHLVLARFFRYVGDRQRALEDAVRALELMPDDVSPALRFDHELTLAIALSMTGSYPAARQRFQRAGQLADSLNVLRFRLSVLNNQAYSDYEAGDAAASLVSAERMRVLAEAHDEPLQAPFIDTLARAYLANGRYEDARTVLLTATAPGSRVAIPDADAIASCLLTLAEVYRCQADNAAVEDTLDRCLALSGERGLAELRANALLARARLYADQGRYREAYEQHVVFHAEWEALYRAERDARARITQAVFEATEARRDSERFRELSFRDPLTGLYNRRYVEEQLPVLVAEALESHTPVAVVVLDLDHFKRVNDRCSHDAGDRVLSTVAGFLSAATAADLSAAPSAAPWRAFAARLGGEEFLLVLPAHDAAQAAARCEDLRTILRAYDWQPLTGDLPVTASFGVAATTTDTVVPTTSSDLLRKADQHLYAAKHAGRDRVVADS